MKYEDAPKSFTAAYKAYMQRVQNNVSQAITQSNSIPVLDKMPLKPTPGYVYSFTRALSPEIPKPGIYVWSGSGWIGNMDENQWGNDRISDVSFAKVTAGTLGVEQLVLSNNAGSNIRSANYSPGTAGFSIAGNGSCEFQNAMIRGTLFAQDLLYGTIAEARFADDTIGGGPIKSGAVHKTVAQLNSQIYANYSPYLSVAGATNTYLGPLTLAANSYRSGVLLFADVWPHIPAVNTGPWSSGFARNSTTGWIGNSHWFTQHTGYYGMGKPMFYYDTGAGTGSVSYYLGVHQNTNGTSSQYCYCTFIALEISK